MSASSVQDQPSEPATISRNHSSPGLISRVLDRARWELREWRTPSTPSFMQEELDHALLNEINWVPGERMLDVGCASGAYCNALRSRGVKSLGVDLSLPSLQKARRAGIHVGQASAMQLPFADGAFDVVLCHKTLYLLSPPPDAARELARIVRPGGRIIFSSSNQTSPYMRVQAGAQRHTANSRWRTGNVWSPAQWMTAFNQHGFRTTAIFSCNLVWPIVYRICDTWLIPNEWMRRYARTIRRITRAPLRTKRLLGAAQDYVIEMTRN